LGLFIFQNGLRNSFQKLNGYDDHDDRQNQKPRSDRTLNKDRHAAQGDRLAQGCFKHGPQDKPEDLRYLRATFRFGIGKRFITNDPTEGLGFFPVEKKVKYVPSATDLDQVIACADPDTQDYLWVIRETMARVGEVNRLKWDDVNFEVGYVVLYTRKKSGGHLTPRKVPMTQKLHEVLSWRFRTREPSKPWVFWHRYWSRKQGTHVEGPYGDRKKIMQKLCSDAKVKYFRFHPIRHSGASIMDGSNVPIGAIQRILGHENRKTTEIYLHSMGEAERDAMRTFEKARQESHTNPTLESNERKKG
jgi:integrase